MSIVPMLLLGLTVPFLGTVLGSACVFCVGNGKNARGEGYGKSEVIGVSAGLMTAASFFSLLLPAVSASSDMWKAVIGFSTGILLLSLVDRFLSSDLSCDGGEEKTGADRPRTLLMMIAVILHNVPEGMAVGTALASVVSGGMSAEVFAIFAAIAIQNFPDGAIVSMPLCFIGEKKSRAFLYGVLSGAVEPVFAVLTFFLAGRFSGLLPVFLAFAAGSMLYVVVRELIPEMKSGRSSGMAGFTVGFLLLMILDLLLGT